MPLKKQPHIVKYSELHLNLDEIHCAAAYFDHLLIGQVTLNKQSQTIFDMDRTVEITPNNYSQFVQSLKKGKQYYESSSLESFAIDLDSVLGKREPLYKLFATFSKANDTSLPVFQLRYQYFYSRDKRYFDQLNKGTIAEIVSDEPYIWMKRGICLSEYSLDQLLGNIDNLILASSVDNDATHSLKLRQFCQYGVTHFSDEINYQLTQYPTLKQKDRLEFVNTIISSMTEREPEFRGDECKIQNFKTLISTRLPVVFALFGHYQTI